MPKFSITDDWLQIDGRAVPRFDTPHVGGRMTPSLIVLHDTAGRLTRGSSVAWFLNPASRVSAHFVVERDGSVVQMAPCDRQTWHAGKSEWRGRRHVNGFGIGIEIVNPGKLTKRGANAAVAWFGEMFDCAACGIEERATDQHGRGLWMPYTTEQIKAVEGLIDAIAAAYPSVREVVGHYEISPGRKVDPCPLMPPRLLGAVRRPRPVAAPAADVADAQARLDALGYSVGLVDGELGTRTEAAIFAFQRQNGMKATGKLDELTATAIMRDDAKPMPTATRDYATERDLAGQSRTVDEQRAARGEGKAMVGLGVATTVLTVVGQAGQVIKQIVVDFGGEALLVCLAGGLAAYGVRTWRRSNRTIRYRVEDHRTGKHVGAGGKA